MANAIYFVLDEKNDLIGAVKFNPEREAVMFAPKIGDLLVGQRKDMLVALLAKKRWSLITPADYESEHA